MNTRYASIIGRAAIALLVMMLPSISAWADNVTYIDENGNLQNVDATVLDNTMNNLAAGWYVVNSDVTYSGDLNTNGDGYVNIILCDGKTLTADNLTFSGENRLKIYGQSQGTGTANISGTLVGNYSLTINGGTIKANSIGCDNGSVGINGGKVNVGSIGSYYNVGLYGGNVIVTGKIDGGGGSVVLGGATVKAGSYTAHEFVCISKGLTYYDGTGANYTGSTEHYQGLLNLTDAEIAAIGGKTLRTFDYRGGTCGDPNVNSGADVTWLYNIDTHTLTISGTGAMADYNSLDDRPWHNYRGNITSVVIESGVTHIGKYAFKNCNNTNLTSIIIPASVESIGDGAFENCTYLSRVYVLRTTPITTLGGNAFDGCNDNLVIYVPNGTDNVYGNTTNWSGYTIDALTANGNCGPTGHESEVFWYLVNNTLTISGTGAMADYNKANAQPWKDNRTDITSAVIGAGVTCIGEGAFDGCSNLTGISVDFNNQNYFSDSGVLFNKTETTLIRYPEGKSGTSYEIPDGVTSIGDGAFNGCSNLTEISVDLNNQNFSSESGVLFNKTKTTLIRYPQGKGDASYTIPDDVKSIGDYAFYECGNLETITLDVPLTSIGKEAFYGCENLTSIFIHDNVTSIGDGAFNGCSNLTEIRVDYWNENFSEMDGVLFNKTETTLIRYPQGKSGTSFTIPASVENIGKDAFYGCTGLTSVYVLRNSSSDPEITSLGNNVFSGCTNLAAIVVPAAVYNNYNTAWSSFSSILTRGYTVTCNEGITATSFAPIVAQGETVTLSYTGDVPAGCDVRFSIDGGTTTLAGKTFAMPYNNVTVTAVFPEKPKNTDAITYVDAGDKRKTKDAGTVYILDGLEETLGQSGDDTWYVVNSNLTYTTGLTLKGNVHLILADGTRMTVTNTSGTGISGTGNFAIYNQCYYGEPCYLTVTGSEHGICCSGAITINGGIVDATGGTADGCYGIKADGDITLSWTDDFDCIKASSYSGNTVSIAEGWTLIAGSNSYYSGTLSTAEIAAIAGKTLRPLTTVTCSGVVAWNDNDDQYVIRPDGVTVHLYKNGDELNCHQATAADAWAFDFGPMPSFDIDGDSDIKTPVVYTLVEDEVVGYSADINGFTITNTLVTSGTCGATVSDNLTWAVTDTDNNGTFDKLTISGTGAMADYDDKQPWVAFKDEITTVVIGDGLTSIGDHAFDNSALESVIIPASVESIGAGAFNGCSNLSRVYVLRTTPITTLGGSAFDGCDAYIAIVVPAGAFENYYDAWSSYRSKLTPGYTVTCGTGITATSYAPIVTQGETVTLGYTGTVPDNYTFAGYSVKDALNNNDVTVTETSGVYTFLMPASDVTASVVWHSTGTAVEVSYIDENGNPQTAQAIPLDNTMNNLTAGWYFVGAPNIHFDQTLHLNNNGTSYVHIILADGCNMSIGTNESRLDGYGIDASDIVFSIYGQTNGTGALNIYTTGNEHHGIYSLVFNLNGGNITANTEGDGAMAIFIIHGNTYINGGTITANTAGNDANALKAWSQVIINGGTINATAIKGKGLEAGWRIFIYGGTVSATGGQDGISAGEITLAGGTVNATGDFEGISASEITLAGGTVTASSYDGDVSIANGLIYSDGTNNYTGVLTSGQINAIATKTLTPAGATLTIDSGIRTYANTVALDFTGIDGLTAYVVSDFDGTAGTLTLSTVDAAVPAGTGLLLKGTANTQFTVPVAASASAPAQNYLVGVTDGNTIVPVTDGGNTNFILANGDYGIDWYTLSGDGRIGANKAYLSLPTASLNLSASRGFTWVYDDGTTKVTNTNFTNDTNSDEWFSLDGRKLSAKPTQKGIYIHNGNKRVIK